MYAGPFRNQTAALQALFNGKPIKRKTWRGKSRIDPNRLWDGEWAHTNRKGKICGWWDANRIIRYSDWDNYMEKGD